MFFIILWLRFGFIPSQYFKTRPYACDPSSLPTYPPSKEIDAKNREEARRWGPRLNAKPNVAKAFLKWLCCYTDEFNESLLFFRKKVAGRSRGPDTTRKPSRKSYGSSKLATAEVSSVCSHQEFIIESRNVFLLESSLFFQDFRSNTRVVDKTEDNVSGGHTRRERKTMSGWEAPKPSLDLRDEASHVKNASHGDIPFSGPLLVSSSSGFAWAKRRKDDASARSHVRSISRSQIGLEPSNMLQSRNNNIQSRRHEDGNLPEAARTNSRDRYPFDSVMNVEQSQWCGIERPDSFDASDEYHSQELSVALYLREGLAPKRNDLVTPLNTFSGIILYDITFKNDLLIEGFWSLTRICWQGYHKHGDKIEFSGPLLSQSYRIDELLEKHERHVRQAVRRSWFHKGSAGGFHSTGLFSFSSLLAAICESALQVLNPSTYFFPLTAHFSFGYVDYVFCS